MSESLTQWNVILIGIAGPSGCGKSTYAKHLAEQLRSPFRPIELDSFFRAPLIIEHSILGRIKTLEQPECLAIDDFTRLLQQMKSSPNLLTQYHRTDISLDWNERIFIIVEGFLLFALSDEITDLFDVKIFLDATLAECRLRRYRRRIRIAEHISNDDVNISEEFQQWFDHLVWNEYLKRRDLQMSKAEKIFTSNEYNGRVYRLLDDYIVERVKVHDVQK